MFVTGELTTNAQVDFEEVVRNTLSECGYPGAYEIKVILNIGQQSPDISQGVDREEYLGCGNIAKRICAGDQGIMYGYATNETKELMPLEYNLARELAYYIDKLSVESYAIGSDFKTQVTVARDVKTNRPLYIDTILVSVVNWDEKLAKKLVKQQIEVFKFLNREYIDSDKLKIMINPTGKFSIGWFDGDAGVTGRKIIVDTYGGRARHGGGAFSGKDYTKVDRSAAYMARHMAKSLVANGLCDECEIQLAYVIGKENAVSFNVNTYGTENVSYNKIIEILKENFDTSVEGIIETLGLKSVKYSNFSAYGHFGVSEKSAPWELIKKLEVSQ